MTVRDLKDMISNMDDNSMVTLQTPDGAEREIVDASKQGDRIMFWADSTS